MVENTQITQVVSAAFVRDERLLLALRGPGSHAGKWCTPGGKVDPGESHAAALARELREELGVRGQPSGAHVLYVYEGQRTTAPKPFVLTCYLLIPSAHATFVPNPAEGIVDARWFNADEIATLDLAPADAANRAALIACLRAR